MSRRIPAVFALALAACGGAAPAPTATPAPAPASEAPPRPLTPPDGNQRLGHDVVPLRYDLDLTIDPAKDRFTGAADVDVTVFAPTDTVVLHGSGLELQSVSALVGKQEIPAKAVAGPNGGLGLRFASELPAGPAKLRFRYGAELPEVPVGAYRVKDGADWYAFTQFEAIDARRAFPCFDQPEFKTPFALTLRVPKGEFAFANAPQAAKTEEGGLSVFEFAPTKPLPTYLVAFAVGPFDVAEAPAGALPFPLRVIATRGKGKLAGLTLERAPVIVKSLSSWFEADYPYEKLDLVAVPNFAAGAMENAGLVTFRETLLLLDPKQATPHDRYRSESVIAHELSHMWFGDYVTMAWWDDIWLNEAFATWSAFRTLAEIDPQFESDLDAVDDKSDVMHLDSEAETRAIRQPIRDGGDVYNAFDDITYDKGAAVLRMIEQWVGPQRFRLAIEDYLSAHAYGTATTDDLLASLDRVTGKPVTETASLFLDQPGTPFVKVALTCASKTAPATLALSQSRYLPAGSKADGGKPWRVPVCVRHGLGNGVERECFMLDAPEKSFTLAKPGCPDWLYPNADENGYYRWNLPADQLRALLGKHRAALTPRERVALPGQLLALLEAGALEADAYLDGLTALAQEDHRLVVQGVIAGVEALDHAAVGAAQRPAFARFVQSLLAPRLAKLGAEPGAKDDVSARLLRPALVPALAGPGADPKLLARGRAVAQQFAADPASVDPAVAEAYLNVGAWSADEALWQKLKDAVGRAETPDLRAETVGALGAVGDPALLARSYDLILDGTLLAQDYVTLGRALRDRPELHAAAWAWMTGHYDALVKKLGDEEAVYLPYVADGFCSADDRAKVAAFFAQPGHAPAGTERNVSLVLEDIDRCSRLRDATAAPLATRLAKPHR